MSVTALYDVGQEVFAINEELGGAKWAFVKDVVSHICIPDDTPTINYTIGNHVYIQDHVFANRAALLTWVTNNVIDVVVE